MRLKRIAGSALLFCVIFSCVSLAYAQDGENYKELTSGKVPADMAGGKVVEYPVEGGSIYFDTTTGTVVGADQDWDNHTKEVTAADIPEEINGVTVKAIGDEAFQACIVTDIHLPSTITSIGNDAFSECNNLETINIPEGVTSIGKEAFYPCRQIKTLVLPDSLTILDESALQNCDGVKTLNIPKNLTNIGAKALSFMNGLETITVDADNPNYVSKDNVLYTKDMKTLVMCPMQTSATSCVIPNGVAKIEESAFAYARNVREITLPDSLVAIGNGAFVGCPKLESITIPGSVKEMGFALFDSCEKLGTVKILEGVTTIPINCFYGNKNLTSVALPQSITSFGETPFMSCDKLKTIHCVKGSYVDNPGLYLDYDKNPYPVTFVYDYAEYDAKAEADATHQHLLDINNDIKVVLNGETLLFEQPPIIENGTTLVPMRAIFEALDASVDWDNESKTVIAYGNEKNISLVIDSKTATVNGQPVSLAAPAKLINGTTMVPLRFIGESLGAEVNWDASTRTITIEKEYEN